MVSLDPKTLGQLMAIIQELGVGEHLDDILEHIAAAVVDVIGFDAVAVNVVTRAGDLQVRTVVGPPELESLLGGVLSQDGWLALLDASEWWGELCFCRSPVLDESVPHVDPWPDRFIARSGPDADDSGVEPWQPEFALLIPMWRGPRELLGVISVDLPRSGLTPDFQQRALLELFGTQAAAAILRVHAVDLVTDKAGLYRAAFAASPAPTLVLDAQLRITDANAAFLEMADALANEVIGRRIDDLVVLPGVGVEQTGTALAALGVNEAAVLADECALRHPRRQAWDRWVQVQARRVDGAATGPNYVCIVTDRTAMRQTMDALRQRAERDDLTGLYLRATGMDQLVARCQQPAADNPDAQHPSTTQAVLYCDLDNFKSVNDADGHRAGDEVLVAVARCMQAVTEETDVVCRWGGDEFVLIASRPTMGQILDLAHELVAAVQALAAAAAPGEPMRTLDVSVGIAEFIPPAEPAAVLEAADRALYRAKIDTHRQVHVHMK